MLKNIGAAKHLTMLRLATADRKNCCIHVGTCQNQGFAKGKNESKHFQGPWSRASGAHFPLAFARANPLSFLEEGLLPPGEVRAHELDVLHGFFGCPSKGTQGFRFVACVATLPFSKSTRVVEREMTSVSDCDSP